MKKATVGWLFSQVARRQQLLASLDIVKRYDVQQKYIDSDSVIIYCSYLLCSQKDVMPQVGQEFTLDELCSLTGQSKRTIRYYIQLGLVARPDGETRAARYGQGHLETLLTIRRWTEAGLSLERVRELLSGMDVAVPPRPRRYGELEVWSRVVLADGVELSVNPERANLTPEQVRQFFADVTSVFDQIQQLEQQQ